MSSDHVSLPDLFFQISRGSGAHATRTFPPPSESRPTAPVVRNSEPSGDIAPELIAEACGRYFDLVSKESGALKEAQARSFKSATPEASSASVRQDIFYKLTVPSHRGIKTTQRSVTIASSAGTDPSAAEVRAVLDGLVVNPDTIAQRSQGRAGFRLTKLGATEDESQAPSSSLRKNPGEEESATASLLASVARDAANARHFLRRSAGIEEMKVEAPRVRVEQRYHRGMEDRAASQHNARLVSAYAGASAEVRPPRHLGEAPKRPDFRTTHPRNTRGPRKVLLTVPGKKIEGLV